MYKLRCRVAEPGTVVPAPDSGHGPKSSRRSPRLKQAQPSTRKSPKLDTEILDQESQSDTESETSPDTPSGEDVPEFCPEQCLFCQHVSTDLDSNLAHMHQAHSLVIPFKASLAVDLHTLIWYLHMVIFSYRECICCGKRFRTVEAVQQHMTSTGHCRFDITEEMSEFYHMDLLASQTSETPIPPDDHTLRLPSGKLLGHRSHSETTLKRRLREKSPADQAALPASEHGESERPSAGSQALAKRDRQEQALTAQLAQLRTGDQMSLMHLSESQRRSQLAVRKKGLDEAKRAERRNRRRLDNVGNKTAIHTNYYKQEVPVYMGG